MRDSAQFYVKILKNDEKLKAMEVCQGIFSELNLDIIRSQDWQRKIYKYAIVIAAFQKKNCCGYIALYANDQKDKVAFISMLGIRPEYQRYGVGTMLLNKGVEEAEKKGMKKIKLEVFKNNAKAIEFYKKNSFMVSEPENESSFYMIRTISESF